MKNLNLIIIIFISINPIHVMGQSNNIHKIVLNTKDVEEIITATYNNELDITMTGEVVEKFDSLGRLKYRSYKSGDYKQISYHFYTDLSDKIQRTINVDGMNPSNNIPDTTVIRYSYNEQNNISNKVVTTTTDSLLWIENFEYNEYNDELFKSYYEAPPWILKIMPEYLKDSSYYDYEANIHETYMVGINGIIVTISGPISNELPNNIFDQFGNLMENDFVKNEYVYDSKDNWIELHNYRKAGDDFKFNFMKKRKIYYRN